MIKIENVDILGWRAAICGMRNPRNSWAKSDTVYGTYWGEIDGHRCFDDSGFVIGPNDHRLMTKLAKSGSVHAKYRRMIAVYLDVIAPLYWWKEFDTYKIGTVVNGCSTMHKITEKEFTWEDFSTEHLGVIVPAELNDGEEVYQNLWPIMFQKIIENLNIARYFYTITDNSELKKKYWWQIIQLLPSSYNQRRTVMLNYEVLTNIYHSRKNHKLDEWRKFCEWIETLPYSELIIEKEE